MDKIKTRRNRKWKIPHTVLERWTLCFSSFKNHKLKVKLWWVGTRERRKRTFIVQFILSEGNLFKICVLSHCIVYWITDWPKASPKLLNLKQDHLLKKAVFLVKCLQNWCYYNFRHRNVRVTRLWSHDHIYNITWITR